MIDLILMFRMTTMIMMIIGNCDGVLYCVELLRENKRLLDKSIRELDREITSQKNSEKKLIAEIKKTAKANQMGAVKVMAKDLVRTRHSVTKFYNLRSQLQGVSLRIQTLKSTQVCQEVEGGGLECLCLSVCLVRSLFCVCVITVSCFSERCS